MNFADPGPRRSVSFLLLLPLLLAAQPVATDGYLPALPEIARDLGSASSSLTVFMLAFGVAQLVCGPLADRFGRRPVLLTGLACYTAAAAGCALAGSADALVAWRAVQGAAMAAILVCARAAVRDLYPAHEGPRIMARGLMGLGLVALVAPIAGAWGVQATGWRWVLVAMGVYSLALLALCWRTFSETRQAPAESAPVLASVPVSVSAGGVRQVIADPGFCAWTALAATTYGGIFCFCCCRRWCTSTCSACRPCSTAGFQRAARWSTSSASHGAGACCRATGRCARCSWALRSVCWGRASRSPAACWRRPRPFHCC